MTLLAMLCVALFAVWLLDRSIFPSTDWLIFILLTFAAIALILACTRTYRFARRAMRSANSGFAHDQFEEFVRITPTNK